MPIPQSMRRAAAATPARSNSNSNPSVQMRSGVKTGAAMLEEIESVEQKQQHRREVGYLPFRFRLKKGDAQEIIILDEWFVSDIPGKGGALVVEHDIQQTKEGYWDDGTPKTETVQELCLAAASGAHCPWCSQGTKQSRRVLMTCYETREYTSKGTRHPGSRRLLAIPLGAKAHFLQLQRAAEESGHTMKGMLLRMERGMEDTSYAIGEPSIVEGSGGRLFEMLDWDDIVATYGNEAIMSTQRPGQVAKRANVDLEPVDYIKAFSVPEKIHEPQRTRAAGVPAVLPGSMEETEQGLQEEDNIPYEDTAAQEEPQPQTTRPAVTRTAARAAVPAAPPAGRMARPAARPPAQAQTTATARPRPMAARQAAPSGAVATTAPAATAPARGRTGRKPAF